MYKHDLSSDLSSDFTRCSGFGYDRISRHAVNNEVIVGRMVAFGQLFMMDVRSLSFILSSFEDNVVSFRERVMVGSTAARKAFSSTATRYERKHHEDQW